MVGLESLIPLAEIWRPGLEGSTEALEISRIANALRTELGREPLRSNVVAANQPRANSRLVEIAMAPALEALGFEKGRKDLFKDHDLWLRPDGYMRVGESGIILEIERGMTVANCRDVYDFWKCHVCPSAHYLFLVVPIGLQHNSKQKPRRVFEQVKKRLGPLFRHKEQTDVRGLCIFGY